MSEKTSGVTEARPLADSQRALRPAPIDAFCRDSEIRPAGITSNGRAASLRSMKSRASPLTSPVGGWIVMRPGGSISTAAPAVNVMLDERPTPHASVKAPRNAWRAVRLRFQATCSPGGVRSDARRIVIDP
jgi:hypothetical protein